jgi:hypothetical protein
MLPEPTGPQTSDATDGLRRQLRPLARLLLLLADQEQHPDQASADVPARASEPPIAAPPP